MGRMNWYKDVVPFCVMVAVECTNVGVNVLFKAATLKGLSYYVFIVYSFAVSTLLLLLPLPFVFRRCSLIIPYLSLSITILILFTSLVLHVMHVCELWRSTGLPPFNLSLLFRILPLGVIGWVRHNRHRPKVSQIFPNWIFSSIFFFLVFLRDRFVAQLCGYKAIQYTSPTLASALSNLMPAFTFILAVFFGCLCYFHFQTVIFASATLHSY